MDNPVPDSGEWYRIKDLRTLPTPSVLLYPDRISENIRRMIRMAGGAERLRPHVKTHKIPELIRMQTDQGITRFKCSTLAEAEMTAGAGGKDILLAYPLLGPSVKRWLALLERYPDVRFSVTVDSEEALYVLRKEATDTVRPFRIFVDLDSGMHRTGISPESAPGLIRAITGHGQFLFAGLHLYDGHIHETDPEERRKHCESDFQRIRQLIRVLGDEGINIPELACGGTPTFPIHAAYTERTCCPGTPVLWDAGYRNAFPDLDYLNAAVLACRVISKPEGALCVDLGHKAVASEMPHPRVRFLEIDDYRVINHSEEHLVITTSADQETKTGQVLYALPVHICPTMALHDRVWVVEQGQVTGSWEVVARNRNEPIA